VHHRLVLVKLCQKIAGVRFFETRCNFFGDRRYMRDVMRRYTVSVGGRTKASVPSKLLSTWTMAADWTSRTIVPCTSINSCVAVGHTAPPSDRQLGESLTCSPLSPWTVVTSHRRCAPICARSTDHPLTEFYRY